MMTDLDAAIAKLRAYKAATAARDALVREALRAGANVNQISTESGISRPTVYRIKENITASRDDIIVLRGEAAAAGDQELAALCSTALDPTAPASASQAAWEECERVIASTKATGD